MEAHFANLIRYRVAATDFVLEFGSFFPGQDERPEATEADVFFRVVMNANLLEALITNLQQAKEIRDQLLSEINKKRAPQEDLPTS